MCTFNPIPGAIINEITIWADCLYNQSMVCHIGFSKNKEIVRVLAIVVPLTKMKVWQETHLENECLIQHW